jgi:hypothetical protein
MVFLVVGGVIGRRRLPSESVVFQKVARLGFAVAEQLTEAVGSLGRNVFVKGASGMSRFEDPLHGVETQRSEAVSVKQCSVESLGRVALTQEQDLSSLVAPLTCRASADGSKELGSPWPHAFIGDAKLVEIDGRAS